MKKQLKKKQKGVPIVTDVIIAIYPLQYSDHIVLITYKYIFLSSFFALLKTYTVYLHNMLLYISFSYFFLLLSVLCAFFSIHSFFVTYSYNLVKFLPKTIFHSKFPKNDGFCIHSHILDFDTLFAPIPQKPMMKNEKGSLCVKGMRFGDTFFSSLLIFFFLLFILALFCFRISQMYGFYVST